MRFTVFEVWGSWCGSGFEVSGYGWGFGVLVFRGSGFRGSRFRVRCFEAWGFFVGFRLSGFRVRGFRGSTFLEFRVKGVVFGVRGFRGSGFCVSGFRGSRLWSVFQASHWRFGVSPLGFGV